MKTLRWLASWTLYGCGSFWYLFATRWLDGAKHEWVWRVAYRPYNFFMVSSANIQGETVYGPWRDTASGRTR